MSDVAKSKQIPAATSVSPKDTTSTKAATSAKSAGSPRYDPETDIISPDHFSRDDLPTDYDSCFQANVLSSTASVSSSIMKYRELGGRTYHKEIGNAQYWAANDDKQNQSMEINHYVLTMSIGDRLYLSPLQEDKLERVIDIGTGIGLWAIDFADEHPDVSVIGTDISPIQPSWVPPNLQFQIDDCTLEWTFEPSSSDFIHMRWLIGSIVDWTALFKEAYKTLKPGGWLESNEAMCLWEDDDGSIPPDSAVAQWGKLFTEGGRKLGRSFTIVGDGTQENAMREAGFVNIKKYKFKVPVGMWPKDPKMKEIGQAALLTLEADPEGYIMFIANTVSEWTDEQIKVYVAHIRKEMRSGLMHPWYNLQVMCGQKPENAE